MAATFPCPTHYTFFEDAAQTEREKTPCRKCYRHRGIEYPEVLDLSKTCTFGSVWCAWDRRLGDLMMKSREVLLAVPSLDGACPCCYTLNTTRGPPMGAGHRHVIGGLVFYT